MSLQINWKTATRAEIENAIGVTGTPAFKRGIKKLSLGEINLISENKNVELVRFANYIDVKDEFVPTLHFDIVFECDENNEKELIHRRTLSVEADVKNIRTTGIEIKRYKD